MAEQSHRDEMNAAIRAQRERQQAARSSASAQRPPVPPEAEVAADGPAPSLRDRLRRRGRSPRG